MESKDFIAFLKVFLILDHLIFSNLFVWFQELKSKEWKIANVAEQVANTYGRLCILKDQYRRFFGDATVSQSVTSSTNGSQMEINNGPQTEPAAVVGPLLADALQHLCNYFKSKFDCWMQPPLVLAQ